MMKLWLNNNERLSVIDYFVVALNHGIRTLGFTWPKSQDIQCPNDYKFCKWLFGHSGIMTKRNHRSTWQFQRIECIHF